MNIPRIVNAIGYIDDDLITAALEDPPRKRHNPMIKWMPVASCLVLVMIASILVPHFFRKDAVIEDKYKYHIAETERARWNEDRRSHWSEQTESAKQPCSRASLD